MAGNTLQIGSDNALRVKSNGLVVAGASDPCCCSVPCSQCSGTTPASIRVVFDSVTLCTTGCTQTYSGTHWSNIVASIDGTYDLPQVSGSPCSYSAIIGSVDIHDNSGCTGSPISNGTTNNGGIVATVTLGASSIDILVSFSKLSGGAGTLLYFFSASYSIAAPYDCTADYTVNNGQVVGDCGSYMVNGSAIAYDGTCDISVI